MYLHIDWRRLICIVVFPIFFWLSCFSFSFPLSRPISLYTLCRRPGILVLINETDWELLVWMEFLFVMYSSLLLYSADCFTNFYHPIFLLLLLLSFILFRLCIGVCRVNLTMKFSQMTTYSSFQHCMVDKKTQPEQIWTIDGGKLCVMFE